MLDLQFFGGRGAQSGGGNGGGGASASSQSSASTPSGISYNQLMQMSETERYDAVDNIINDSSIQVPDYLDNSVTTKVMYALGMNNTPTVVDDKTLDFMPGEDLFRTVYESGTLPPPTSDAILDQIRNGEYTQMSGSGGSVHSRAIYFANDFQDSAYYGKGEQNPLVMRVKVTDTTNIVSEKQLRRAALVNDTTFRNSNLADTLLTEADDYVSIYAITHGIDGWSDGSYTMILNRGCLTASSSTRGIAGSGGFMANSWRGAQRVS